ncbi:cilia- and flagella-associated protein 157-like [Trichosurus vulpecula]|uniref:cilia- and flagella-associated protein 157-like n=1 Tax=Trichosurus vulpecula TaxID=9337 RepID=UPI00186B57A5|nr:cilia- and flagella-associated protein 157-like [Trichosurus vulpecula]
MGPKKGGGEATKKAGEGGKKKGKKGGPPSPKATEEVITEEIRKFYQIQIQDLEKRIIQYQKKWDEMVVKDKLLRAKFEKLAQNKKEIVSFLKRSLSQRVFEITELNEQLQGLQISKEMEKNAFESQLAQVRHEFQETKNQLISENVLLGGKLAALDEYRTQKEELMAKFAMLEEQLKKEQDEYKDWIYALEKNAVLEKDRLKKEIVQRVNKVAIEFRKVSALQMSETTRKVIQENMVVNKELAKVSNQSLQLIQENEELKGDTKEMSKQLDLLESNRKMMSSESVNRLKLIWFLAEKCEEQQQKMEEAEKIRAMLEQLEMAFQQLQQDNHDLRNDIEELKMKLRYNQVETKRLTEELEREQKRSQNVEQVLTHARFLLRDLLSMHPEHVEDGQFNVLFQMEQKEILYQLMAMLSHAVVLGPHVAQFIGVRQKAPHFPTKTLQERCENLKPIQQLTKSTPYRLSGLSAMFQPAHIPFNPKDIEMLSQTTRLRKFKVSTVPEISFPNSFSRFTLPAITLKKRQLSSASSVPSDPMEKETEEEEQASPLEDKPLFPEQGEENIN